jgi:hypothetical protein
MILPEHREENCRKLNGSLGDGDGGDACGGGGGCYVADAFGDGDGDIRLSQKKNARGLRRLVYDATTKSPGAYSRSSEKNINLRTTYTTVCTCSYL